MFKKHECVFACVCVCVKETGDWTVWRVDSVLRASGFTDAWFCPQSGSASHSPLPSVTAPSRRRTFAVHLNLEGGQRGGREIHKTDREDTGIGMQKEDWRRRRKVDEEMWRWGRRWGVSHRVTSAPVVADQRGIPHPCSADYRSTIRAMCPSPFHYAISYLHPKHWVLSSETSYAYYKCILWGAV